MKSTKKLQQTRENQRKVRIAGNALQREKECAIITSNPEMMLMEGVLKQTRFERLNNVLRYPNYNPGKKCYTMIEANYKDCEALKQMADQLQKMLDDIWKRII